MKLLIPAGRLNSPFGPRKLRGTGPFHKGIDLGFGTGSKSVELFAPFDGILSSSTGRSGGLSARVRTLDGEWVARLGHLSDVMPDGPVKAGDVIARSGDTGCSSTGHHLHFQLERKGVAVNPLDAPGFEVERYDAPKTDQNIETWRGQTCRINYAKESIGDSYGSCGEAEDEFSLSGMTSHLSLISTCVSDSVFSELQGNPEPNVAIRGTCEMLGMAMVLDWHSQPRFATRLRPVAMKVALTAFRHFDGGVVDLLIISTGTDEVEEQVKGTYLGEGSDRPMTPKGWEERSVVVGDRTSYMLGTPRLFNRSALCQLLAEVRRQWLFFVTWPDGKVAYAIGDLAAMDAYASEVRGTAMILWKY